MLAQESKRESPVKKESPDVETPGLLVKALISSFFMDPAPVAGLHFYF